MWSRAFWQAAGERAAKTAIQTALPGLAMVTVLDPDWKYLGLVASLSVQAAGLSLLTSIASTLRGDPESPSLVLPPPPSGRHAHPTELG